MPESVDASLAKKPYLDIKADSCQGDRKSAGVHPPVPLTLERRGAMRDGIPDVVNL